MNSGTVVELARSARSAGEFQQALLLAVMRYVGADVAAFGIGGADSPATEGFGADVVGNWASTRRRHAGELGQVLAAARGGVAIDAEILGETRVRSTRYFAELVRPHGGRETLCALPSWGGVPAGCLWLGRCGPAGRFRRRDVAGLAALLPAIAMASVVMAAPRIRPPAGAALSARESEIVDLLRLGLRSREIAAALGTSTNTVRNQIWRLMARLDAGTRGELIARCRANDRG